MSTPADATLARLESLVGHAHFLTDPGELAFLSVDGCLPRACVQPNSVELICEIVKFCAAEKLALIPIGSGAQLGIGAPPARYDVALRLSHLAQILSYDPGDLTLSVQAGMHLGSLNQHLRRHGQFLPLDSRAGDFATIGGILASNSSGHLRHSYGTPRDFVLGLEFVTGEGARTKSGGRVVKSVAGFDIHKLMIGALGTLGIITSANFKTFPLPPVQSTFAIRFRELAGALAFRGAMAKSYLQPRALDIVSPQAARYLRHADASKAADLEVPAVDWEDTRKYVGEKKAAEYKLKYDEAAALAHKSVARASAPPLFSESEWTVLVSAGGNERVVERHCRELELMAEQTGAASFSEARPDDAERAAQSLDGCEEWRWIRAFPDCVRRVRASATVMKISMLPSGLGKMTEAAQQIAQRYEAASASLLRGVGTLSFAMVPQSSDDAAMSWLASACEEIFAAAQNAGGHAVIELCPTELKKKVNVWGPPRGDLELMRRLKAEFDPHGILSPGRVMGL